MTTTPAVVADVLGAGVDSPYLTAVETAAILRRPVETLRQWRHRGVGPRSVRLGARVMYRREDLSAWLGEQERATAAGGGSWEPDKRAGDR